MLSPFTAPLSPIGPILLERGLCKSKTKDEKHAKIIRRTPENSERKGAITTMDWRFYPAVGGDKKM